MRLLLGLLVLGIVSQATAQSVPLSPAALAASSDGKAIYVACATASRVLCFDTAQRKVTGSIVMPCPPSGLALSPDGMKLLVTCTAPESRVIIIETRNFLTPGGDALPRVQAEQQFGPTKVMETIPVGHTAMAPVVGPDGKTLYVCNRFDNNVSTVDLSGKAELKRVAVQREPVAGELTKDGRFLLVANHLSSGRADADFVAAAVSVVDLAAGKVAKEIQLPNGSVSLKDIRVSPDGHYAVVTHTIANFTSAASEVSLGWITANALTILDLTRMEVRYTVLLDEPNQGAANPWGAAWSSDGTLLAVTHAGTHEVSIIDFPRLVAALPDKPGDAPTIPGTNKAVTFLRTEDRLLAFIGDVRKRIALPPEDLGPRSVVFIGRTAYIANFFSDTLTVLDTSTSGLKPQSIPLGPKQPMDAVRKGEFYFNNAKICFQNWQSCASCHPSDARADSLNWDLLNDGVGNPKNTKSLLLASKTPPAMSLGVRTNAQVAVRAGIKHVLFTRQPEAVPLAIDEYLKSLQPVPSPFLVHGRLSQSATRGQKVFIRAGCAECHPPGLFTDLIQYDVGTGKVFDKPTDKFYTPTLLEVWRTAPYLHDGSARTMRDVLTTCNPHDEHGVTSNLSNQEIDDLCAYVLSL